VEIGAGWTARAGHCWPLCWTRWPVPARRTTGAGPAPGGAPTGRRPGRGAAPDARRRHAARHRRRAGPT
jgi:hypothetical protein